MVEADEKKTGTQSIERALSILRLFADDDRPLSLTEVARTVGLTTATTHRILSTLVRERFLSHDADAERYRIGPDSLFLFAAAARRYGISAARVELEALVARTHETASIGVLDGHDTIVVLQVESDLPLRFSRPVGTRVPSHVSAMGKAMLAASGADLKAAVKSLGTLHRFTEHTIVNKTQLVAELEQARERGYAVNDNERWAGVRAVAVPILLRSSPAPVAALGLQGPTERLGTSRLDEIVAELRTSADRLGLQMPLTRL